MRRAFRDRIPIGIVDIIMGDGLTRRAHRAMNPPLAYWGKYMEATKDLWTPDNPVCVCAPSCAGFLAPMLSKRLTVYPCRRDSL